MADYYEPILRDGHHLGLSRKNDGAFSGNSFDGSGNLGRADWRPVDKDESGPSREVIALAAGAAVALGLFAAAPHIKRMWQEKVFPGLKRRWPGLEKVAPSAIAEGDGRAATHQLAVLSETEGADFSKEIDVVLGDYRTSISSEEAQRRFAEIFLLAALIAEHMRVLSNSRIEDGTDSPELASALEKLTTQQVTDDINRMLETSPSLLSGEALAVFMRIFEGGRVVDGEYVLLRNEKIKEALRLTDGAM